MSQTSERRRKPRQNPPRGTEPLWVMLHNVPGESAEVRARVVDVSDGGIGVELACALQENSFIVVHGLPGNVGPNGKIGARVVRCRSTSEGFHAGLAYEKARERGNQSEEAV